MKIRLIYVREAFTRSKINLGTAIFDRRAKGTNLTASGTLLA